MHKSKQILPTFESASRENDEKRQGNCKL